MSYQINRAFRVLSTMDENRTPTKVCYKFSELWSKDDLHKLLERNKNTYRELKIQIT